MIIISFGFFYINIAPRISLRSTKQILNYLITIGEKIVEKPKPFWCKNRWPFSQTGGFLPLTLSCEIVDYRKVKFA